jgi:DNA-binding response OmpR family regulator
VLLVDPDQDAVTMLAILVALEGGVALKASGAFEAARLLRDHADQIDAAIIAARLRGLAGGEVGQMLREVKPGLCCWLMAGAASGGGPPAGFDGVLLRPFTPAALRDCLAAIRSLALQEA